MIMIATYTALTILEVGGLLVGCGIHFVVAYWGWLMKTLQMRRLSHWP